jgi:transcriptional regulator with PAS, ATPase and Fis domain
MVSLLRTIRDPETLYKAAIDTVRTATAMDRAALFLKAEGSDALRAVHTAGGFAPGAVTADKDIGAIIAIARHLGYPIDSSQSEIPRGKVSDEFLARHPRVICIPLRILDEVAGYLYLDSPREGARTSDDDQSFVVALSQQLALAIEKISLAEKASELEKAKPRVGAIARSKERVTMHEVIGNSPPMKRIYELVESIKDMDTTVLLTGSNGTGKDLIAKMIHYGGPRADKQFVALNCAAFSEDLLESELFGHEKGSFTGAHRQRIGHFESANGGTIFLNEIGDMPLRLQPKLLSVLEDQRFYRVGGTTTISTNVRIITATNKELRALVDQGTFREDLYHRINVFPIRIPDLRERVEDIEPLCNHFLATYCRLYGIPVKKISPEAMACLLAYEWPGNVRELENLINRLIIISKRDTILPEDLPDDIVKKPESVRARSRVTIEETIDSLLENIDLSTSDPILPKVEGVIVNKVVEKIGDKTKAAAVLGISKPTVYSKLRKYGKNKST